MPVCNKECVDKYLPFIFLFFFIVWNGESQSFYLKIDQKIPFSYKTHFKDSAKVLNELDNVIVRLREKGYLLANVDSQYVKKDTLLIQLYKGEQFKWVNVQTNEVEEILRKTGNQNSFYTNKKINYRQFLKIEKQLLSYANNHGYPFAHLSFEPLKIEENVIEGKWHYQSHTLFTFDTLILKTPQFINHGYLQSVLALKKGEIYRKKKIDQIAQTLQKLGFIELSEQVEIKFQKNIYKLIISVKNRKQNDLNGLIGFLPKEDNQVQFTGDVKLHLVNLFKIGIQTDILWRKPDQFSQQLDLNYQHPFILKTILSPNLQFNLQKQDTTFLTIARKVNFDFFISPESKVNLGLIYKTSQNIQTNKDSLFQDFSNLSYSLLYQYNKVDNYLFPKKGWFLETSLSVGEKKLAQKKEGILEKTWQSEWSISTNYYLKLYKKWHVLLHQNYRGIENFDNQLWDNDLFQIGGFKTLRGFNENEFRASQWIKLSVEPRYWFDETSFIYTFFERSYLKYKNEKNVNGVGIGVQLQVKNGIFNFATALGADSQQKAFNINLFKVHFGLVTKF